MTRGRCGSLILHRMNLSFTTPRRFNPAHKESDMTAKMRFTSLVASLFLLALLPAALAADSTAGLSSGKPDLKSAGPMAFGPEGILLVGDPQGAAVFAIDTGDRARGAPMAEVRVRAVNEKIAALLGTSAQEILINDMAVNPVSGKVYLSVS